MLRHTQLSSVAFLIILLSVGCNSATLDDYLNSLTNIVVGNVIDLVNSIPTVDQLFQLAINVVAGLPFEQVFNLINTACAAASSAGTLTSRITPDLNKMNFQLRSACNKYNYPLLNSSDIWFSPEFDQNKSVVIYASGFMNTINDSSSIDGLSQAYNCRGDVNFVASKFCT